MKKNEVHIDERPRIRLVDTHAHLADDAFAADLPAVLERAGASGVGVVVAVSERLPDAERVLRLAGEHPGAILACAGLHPEFPFPDEAERMEAFVRRHRTDLTAIGEVGLDHWLVKDEEARGVQRDIFERFVRLSLELDLPLNVHSRSAGEKTIAVLLDCNARRVQLHAFDGRASKALPAVEAGYFFSIPPSVVRSPQKQKLVRRLPLDCLLLETDSPVLGPTAGERNEPANLPIALKAVSEIKGISEAEVALAVAENAKRLYGRLSV